MKRSDTSTQERLPVGWVVLGTFLFAVALGVPIALHGKHAGTLAELLPDTSALATSLGGAAQVEDGLTAEVAPIGDAALRAADRAEPGSLAQLVGRQDQETLSEGRQLRRLVLDAVAVDLEGTSPVDEVAQVVLPVSDCSEAGGAQGDLLTADGEIAEALSALGPRASVPEFARDASQNDITLSLDGLKVAYCDDARIAGVEILPIESTLDPTHGMALIAMAPEARHRGEEPALHLPAAVSAGEPAQQAAPRRAAPGAPTTIHAEIRPVSISAPPVGSPAPVSMTRIAAAPASVPESRSDRALPAGTPPLLAQSGLDTPILPDSSIAAEHTARPIAPTIPAELLAFSGSAYLLSDDATPTGVLPTPVRTAEKSVPVRPGYAQRIDMMPIALLATTGDMALEEALGLNRRARRTAQIRLSLLGHDTNGIDGIFGDGTRGAIADLQRGEALPATGYLDEITLAVLNRKSQSAYKRWQARVRAKRERRAARLARKAAEAETAPDRVANVPPARQATTCARDSQGVIISNQSFSCDLSVLQESLGKLFRNRS